jgi:hypothetical protein
LKAGKFQQINALLGDFLFKAHTDLLVLAGVYTVVYVSFCFIVATKCFIPSK